MAKSNLTIRDFERIELNEAFAAQANACVRELDCDMEITNRVGNGISLGRPIGCTGAGILVTLMYQMQQNDLSPGLAALCIGGGQGMAMVLFKQSKEILGSNEKAMEWFHTSSSSLSGATPFEYAVTEPGAQVIREILNLIEIVRFSG